MPKTELKTIPVNEILANFTQPREEFDKEKTKELAESILSNGLINPITVRDYKSGRWMIVSGERRWQAHKIAKLKTIQAFVKRYKNDGQWMIESLIENVHREDLSPREKGKYLSEIKRFEKISTIAELSRRTKINTSTIAECIDNYEFTKKKPAFSKTKHKIIRSTFGMENKEREKIIKLAEKKKLSGTAVEEEFVPIYQKATPEVKEALISDDITTEQAESLSKIHSDKAREKALEQVKQHRHIADITPKLMERAKPELTKAIKKKFDTAQRKVFEYLNEAKVSLSKSNKNLKEANLMLVQLMSKSFEDGLPKKSLVVSMQQMKSISDKINEFEIQIDKFDELKDTFIERVEEKLEEEK